ncbi:MAG TPA: tetratricopeptide repeat protein [Pirellulales bacterium]|nr:tetratricopeptide repeat protein [Pirellulales bacterium]
MSMPTGKLGWRRVGLLIVASFGIFSEPAAAQYGTTLYAGPRGTTMIAPPPGPGPLDPLSVAAYWGFWPNPVIARQPIGHQTIATSPNGYVYRPVYANDPTAASIAMPNVRETLGPSLVSRLAAGPPSPRELLEAALVLFKAGRYESAIDRANAVLDVEADNGDALLLLVQCYFGLANYEAAADALAAALAHAPEHDWDKYVADYKKLFASPLRFASHLRSLERFVELYPGRREGHLLIGYQYGCLGESVRALKELALAKPSVEADKLARHFVAANDAPAPAPEDEVEAPPPVRQPPARRRGREF